MSTPGTDVRERSVLELEDVVKHYRGAGEEVCRRRREPGRAGRRNGRAARAQRLGQDDPAAADRALLAPERGAIRF